MGGAQAAKVLLQIQVSSQKSKGEIVSKRDEEELLKKITERYDRQTSPYYAAARLWVDEIIDPRTTRSWISAGIEAASYAPLSGVQDRCPADLANCRPAAPTFGQL